MKTEEVHQKAAGLSVSVPSRLETSRGVLSSPLFLVVVDLGLAALAYGCAWLVRLYIPIPFTQDLLPQERWDVVEHFWVVLAISQAFFLYILGLYDDLRVLRRRELLAQTFMACTFQVVTISSLFYLTNEVFPRTVILFFGLFNFVGVGVWRAYVRSRVRLGVRRVLVVGESFSRAVEIVDEIEKSSWMGIEVVGMAIEEEDVFDQKSVPCPILGTLADVQEIVEAHGLDEIIFASQESWKDRVLDALSQVQATRRLRIAILPSVYEIAIGRLRHINIHDTPLIEVRRNPSEPFERFIKRTFDLVLSSIFVLALLPFFLLISVAILIASPGPVFYFQKRVGLGGDVFRLIKFRTMVPDAERDCGEKFAEENDPRITSIGAFLRRFRFDELPQVINVLKGDMSFVGPRPERPGFVKMFSKSLAGYAERHKVKPGITGLAQVRGYYHTAAENKLRYDLAYIYNYSFSLDLIVLLETIKVVLIRKGS